jgi:hypothetical protein
LDSQQVLRVLMMMRVVVVVELWLMCWCPIPPALLLLLLLVVVVVVVLLLRLVLLLMMMVLLLLLLLLLGAPSIPSGRVRCCCARSMLLQWPSSMSCCRHRSSCAILPGVSGRGGGGKNLPLAVAWCPASRAHLLWTALTSALLVDVPVS